MKKFLRILRWSMWGFLGLVLVGLVLLLLDTHYQQTTLLEKDKKAILVKKSYESTRDSTEFRQLLSEYGKNKTLPKGFEWQALLALSHYPELKEKPIDFLIQEAMIPLSSRPNPFHLFQPWRERRYLVVISSKSWDILEPILLKNLPFDAQVGVLGHELAHTVYYLDKSALFLVGVAFRYPFASFRKNFERDTDKRAIAHGLGHQLYHYASFVRNAMRSHAKLPDSFEEVEDSYLSPEEIAKEMKSYPEFYGQE
jgi:hypothetical protein